MENGETRGCMPGDLHILKPVLAKWLELIEDADPVHWPKDDVPWWYNERALLSLFSGAVWKCGGWAFEEFAMGKSKTGHWRPKARMGIGRGDLRFILGHARATQHFQAEAKLSNRSMSRGVSDVEHGMRDMREEARQDALKMPLVLHSQRLAIVFIAPYLAAGRRQVYDAHIPALVGLLQGADPLARAWTFPAKGRTLVGEDQYIYPGVGVLIERVP